MKRILAFLLTAILVFSIPVQAFAATVSIEADKTAVAAGEKVIVTLSQSEAVDGVTAIKYYVYYDPSLFELTESTPATNVTLGKTGTDTKGTYQVVNYLDTSSEGVTIPAGPIATLTFTALADVSAEQVAGFELVNKGVMGVGDVMLEDANTVATGSISVTVSPAAPAATYTVALPENPVGYTITATEGSSSPVAEGGSFSFTITVDEENYEGSPVVKVNGISISPTDGVYTISNITADQTVTVEGITEQGLVADKVVYQHGSNGAQWPSGSPVYVNSLTLKGLSVKDVAWDAAYENCTITLHKKTAADASYSLAAFVAVAGQPQMISMFSANVNGASYGGNTFTHSGALENGEAKIVFTAKVGSYSGIKTFNLITEGAVQEPETYAVTLTEGEGYTLAATEGSVSPVTAGGSFSFTVSVNDGYEGTPVVKAGTELLNAENGVYTISNINADVTVSVEGINKVPNTYTVTLTKGAGYTVTATEGSVSPVTEGGNYSFTLSLKNGFEGSPVVKVNGTEIWAADGVYTIGNIAADSVVTVEGISVKANTYQAAASADVIASKNDEVTINVSVAGNSNSEITEYNDYDITVSYDTAALSYVSAAAAHESASIEHDGTAGTIRIVGHGDAMPYSTAIAALKFTAIKSGVHNVTIVSAKVDNSGNAISADAPPAAVTDESTAVMVKYPVSLPEGISGETSVLPGEDYVFTVPEYHKVTVTVGGVEVDPAVSGETYTLADVNGDVVITITGKTYTVTKSATNATVTGGDSAQYGVDYSFTIAAAGGYVINNVAVKIGDKSVSYTIDSNGAYVVSGADIKGDMTITVTTSAQIANTTKITFTGIPAEEVVGGLTQYANNGEDFVFELNEVEGYKYTVTLGTETLIPDAEGKYTIKAEQIIGTDLTISISKTVKEALEFNVTVSEYITLNETSMWLVQAAVEGDAVLTYNGKPMYVSSKYQQSSDTSIHCYLVVSNESEDAVKAAAEAAIAEAPAGTQSLGIAYDKDVNQSGEVDINDAQLTYDMYQAKKYSNFEIVSMDRFLEADLDGNTKVDVYDASMIIDELLK